MAIEIGTIKMIVGTVVATAANGTQRQLQIGDKIFSDEIISTGLAGAVEIEFSDGSIMDLGRSSQAVLDSEVFDPQQVINPTADTDEEIAAIQQAIVEGADPYQTTGSTAAGETGITGEEGHSPVKVDFLEPITPVTSGFETTGPSVAFIETTEEVFPSPSLNDVDIILDATPLITEDDSAINYTATLSLPAVTPMTIILSNGAVITIVEGGFTGTVSFPVTPDSDIYKEIDEYVEVNISTTSGGGFRDVNLPETPNTTTITDSIDTVYVQLGTDDTVKEARDGTLTHEFTLVDKEGNLVHLAIGETIEVSLSYNADSTETEDFATKNTSITMTGNGGSSYSFDNIIVDDLLNEGSESYKVSIDAIVNDSNYFENVVVDAVNNSATGTITDGTIGDETPRESVDMLYAVITGSSDVNEGDRASDYTVQLFDENGTAVTVSVNTVVSVIYSNVSTQDNDTEYAHNDTISVTILAGDSSAKFDVLSHDDPLADNNEVYNLNISDVATTEFENIDTTGFTDTTGAVHSSNVNTTIHDDTGSLNIAEDGPETDHESVIIKLVAADSAGNPIVVSAGGGFQFYQVSETAAEGGTGYYIALAFEPNSAPSPTTLIASNGTVIVSFSDDGTTGASSQTVIDGSQDYDNDAQTITIGTAFSTDIFDDYLAEGNHSFNVAINDNSYVPPSATTGYENVSIDTVAVVTTITDGDSGDETPNESVDTVTVKLVTTDAAGNIISGVTIVEGEAAYYKAILLDPNGDQIVGATGDVAISFTDETAIRTGVSEDAGLDFSATDATVTLNQVFSATALDDYLTDTGETFNVQVLSGSYTNTAEYENTNYDTTPVITKITDDTGNPNTIDATDLEISHEVIQIKISCTR